MSTPVLISAIVGVVLMIVAIFAMLRFSPRVRFTGSRTIVVVVVLMAVVIAVAFSLLSLTNGGRP